MPEAYEDAQWVTRCLRGDAAAFESLVRKYQRVLYAVARRLVADGEDARDVTQNTFVKAYEHLDSFDVERSFFSWLYSIAMHESLNFRRSSRPSVPLPESLAARGGPEESAAASERAGRVRAAVGQLPADLREVIALRHFAELSYREISSVTGVPEKTVKSRLFEARRKLADLMEGIRDV